MKKDKLIDVGGGFSLRFDQRAKGQETPYYIGSIYKDGAPLGNFSNSGTGGPTTIFPLSVATAFRKMFDDEALRQGVNGESLAKMHEKEGFLIEFGEMKGYKKKLADMTFAEYVAAVIADYKKYKLL